MGFEDLARRMNERAGGKPGPIDVAELERKHDRFQGLVMIGGGLFLAAVSIGLNILLAMSGWVFSVGILLTVVSLLMIGVGVKQFWKNLRAPR